MIWDRMLPFYRKLLVSSRNQSWELHAFTCCPCRTIAHVFFNDLNCLRADTISFFDCNPSCQQVTYYEFSGVLHSRLPSVCQYLRCFGTVTNFLKGLALTKLKFLERRRLTTKQNMAAGASWQDQHLGWAYRTWTKWFWNIKWMYYWLAVGRILLQTLLKIWNVNYHPIVMR